MNEPPTISDGMNQRIGALVVELTTAKNVPDRLHAIDKLAADADSHVNVYLREVGGESPSVEKIRRELTDKLEIARANEPDEGGENYEHWETYVEEHEDMLERVGELWGDRVGYRVFVEKWDEMYGEWGIIVSAISMMAEGGQAHVFDTRRAVRRHVELPCEPAMRDLMLRVMGLHDFGQEVVLCSTAIMRGIGELDRRMFAAAGKFSAIFAEIFGDLAVYRDNYYQYLALHRADEKGRLDAALQEQEMRHGGSEMY